MTTTMDSTGRREELRAFLMARRAQVTPEDAGIPGGSRRRTPGLRREEVALLAGVGVSWYQWLEQGRDITVSPQVLDAVSRVLRLNEAERRHLYVLAGLNPPLGSSWERPQLTAGLERLIEGWMPKPAHLVDRYWNLIATNEAARLVLGYRRGQNDNCVASFFLDPMFHALDRNWDATARIVAAQYRAAMSEHPGDTGFAEIVDDLLDRSREFAELWALHEAMPAVTMTKVLDHPVAGELHFESTQLQVPGQSELIMVFHNPVAGTGTAERVERLLGLDTGE
ncbi:helix-turn-helix transcriptional regulator [Leifsonia sp. EB34]|uniref:helix-turn-helix transcriptional regulator n=1 Tax=Leifsonia sp. EB34 TaxID=3156303 RepID=UPI003515C295